MGALELGTYWLVLGTYSLELVLIGSGATQVELELEGTTGLDGTTELLTFEEGTTLAEEGA